MSKKSALLLALVLTASLASAQEVGDYRSAGSNTWATIANWETWNGSSWVTASVLPTASNNVLIRTGHTVTVGSSPYACRNLVVQAGAVLYCNATNGRYINLYGDSVRCDGTIGSPTDGLGFTCMTSVTFTGSGIYQVNRLRPGASNVTIVIDRNFELHYAAAAPYNVALYAYNNSGCIFQVNNGDTLTFTGTAAFSWGTNSSTASSVGGTFIIDGTVIMPSGSNFNISVDNGISSMLQVYGNLVLGDTLIADATTSGDETVVVHGAITYASADTQKFDNLYTNNPAGTSFGFPVRVNGILYIGYGDYDNSSGLSMAYGSHIYRYVGGLTTPPDFDQMINLQYGPNPENLPLVTGHEVPLSDSINSVSFDNAAGVVLSRPMKCYGAVVLEEGIVDADTFYLGCMNQPTRDQGYVKGFLGMYIPTGNTTRTFHVGTDNGYSPMVVDFQNVTVAGGMGGEVRQGTHPYVNIPENTMQRNWHFSTDPVSPPIYDSCQLSFTYLPDDFNTGFTEAGDEGTMVVGKFDDISWSFPNISSRDPGGVGDGGSITISGVTSFSDFTMGKDQTAFTAPQGPQIVVVEHPEDTYDGSGPFIIRALITDPGKSVVTDTLWYTDNKTDWWYVNHGLVTADTFQYSLPGPLAPGTVIEYFIGAYDDAGGVSWSGASQFKGDMFRILDPMPPCSLTATPGDNQVILDWQPPRETISYNTNPNDYWTWSAGNIVSTRFTPAHYPCKLEYSISRWYRYDAQWEQVEMHVWPDNGYGIPDTTVDLITPVWINPITYDYNIIDLRAENLVIGSGDFHIGWKHPGGWRTPLYMYVDGGGPGLRSVFFNGSEWSNVIQGTDYVDLVNRALVSYSGYTKDQVAAKNLQQYDVFRGDLSGGPYELIGAVIGLVYTDNAVIGGNTYYYVVRSHYSSPDTFSVYSNEANATPTGVTGPSTTLGVPARFELAGNYPNPVRTSTTIKFGLPKDSDVRIEVFNIAGQKVKTLASGKLNAGYHTVNWRGQSENGQKVAAGVYLVRMVTPEFTGTRKMTVLR